MPEKIRYEIDLTRPPDHVVPEGVVLRTVTDDDLDGLARLMLDAYMGTIDYEDETIDDAIEEVREFLEDDRSLPGHSYVVEDGNRLVSGVLVLMVDEAPFIGIVMTDPEHKRHGLGRLVTTAALHHLAADGREKAVLYITDGNVASEALFASIGAVAT